MKNDFKTADIEQEAVISATPHQVYDIMLSAKKQADFTAGLSNITPQIGGSFTIFDDYVSGKFLDLVPDELIVESWRAADWPKERYSTVTFILKPIKGGTNLVFSQKGVPAGDAKNISKVWAAYWKALKQYVE